MSINLGIPDNKQPELKPRITVVGVGGAGGNAVNNMIESQLEGVEFVVANTDAQALSLAKTDRRIQLGASITQGLGAGSRPDVGRAAAEESLQEIHGHLQGSNMVFVAAGMGGGTGTGAAPVIAQLAKEQGMLTVGVVTKPFTFEGSQRMRLAEAGIEELQSYVDTLIVIPNQNLFRVANEKTTFADAFKMADDVLHAGVRGVTDLMVMPGLINLDFADIRTVMGEMGKAMMGTGEAEGEKRAIEAAEAAIANPLLEDTTVQGARGVLINITGGLDMTLFEVDEAANRIRDEVDPDANIIFGSTFDESLTGTMRVSVVATGIEAEAAVRPKPEVLEVTDAVATEHRAVQDQAFQPAATVVHMTGLKQTGAPSAPPAQASAESFIPPAAMPVKKAKTATEATAIDPFASADMINGSAQREHPAPQQSAPKPFAKPQSPRKPAMPSLFERVTRTGQAAMNKAKSMTGEAQTARPAQPAPRPMAQQPQEQYRAQPQLGGLAASDRPLTSQSEDDLDIPAFLRRQAN